MENVCMRNKVLKPEILVVAGPNGSGKSTITKMMNVVGLYINADDIKKSTLCSDLEAALRAEELRESALAKNLNFSFETVLSTDRNLKLLQKAKAKGYFLRCIYILTESPEINIFRVHARVACGGHGVPEAKIQSRYYKALALVPSLISTCDIVHIYDNSITPFRIFKKRKTQFFYWENDYWDRRKISMLTGIADF